MVFSNSASKIQIISRHLVKVVGSCEKEEFLGNKLIFTKITQASKLHEIKLNLAKFRPWAKRRLGDRGFNWFGRFFHEHDGISWNFMIFMNSMILWKMWNSWNSAFSSKSGSQNTWCSIGNSCYSASWEMQMSILWDFMENNWNLWNSMILKKNW